MTDKLQTFYQAIGRCDRDILRAAILEWQQRTGEGVAELARRVAARMGDNPGRVRASVDRWRNKSRFPTGMRREALLAELVAVLFSTPASEPASPDDPESSESISSSS